MLTTCSRLFLGASLLTLLTACGGGGGGGSAPVHTLVYTSDASATAADWRVEADPATNGAQTVVLRIYGPTGTPVQGASVFLSCDASDAAWVQPGGATDPYALAGTALDLAQGPNASIQMFKTRLVGSDLQVSAYQKTGTSTLAADKPLFSVALKANAGAAVGAASFSVTASRSPIYLDGSGEHALSLKVGTLVVR